MTLPHFFLESQIIAHEEHSAFVVHLSLDDVKHAKALRLRAGEHIALIDAAKDYYLCEIISFENSLLSVCITQHRYICHKRPQVVLAQGISKGNRTDTVVRHATEVGIFGFIPLLCERCVVKLDEKKTASRMNRLRACAKSAAMQAGRRSIPEIFPPCTLAEARSRFKGFDAVLVCWEEAPLSATLSSALSHCFSISACKNPLEARVGIVIGPEGGLSEAEVDQMLHTDLPSACISLGESILRTETAGIVASALVLYELERCAC